MKEVITFDEIKEALLLFSNFYINHQKTNQELDDLLKKLKAINPCDEIDCSQFENPFLKDFKNEM